MNVIIIVHYIVTHIVNQVKYHQVLHVLSVTHLLLTTQQQDTVVSTLFNQIPHSVSTHAT